MVRVLRIQLGLWHGLSGLSIKTSIGISDYRDYLNLPLNTTSSYEVEDIEPQEDGNPL